MKNHGGAVQDNAETLSEVPILCDPNSPNIEISGIENGIGIEIPGIGIGNGIENRN